MQLSRRNKGANSFGREFSLKSDLAIKRIFESGKKLKGNCLTLYYYKNDEIPFQVALRISRKNGSAPRRNRIKRIIREVLRTNRDLFEPAGQVIITAHIGPNIQSITEVIKKDLMSFAGNWKTNH